MTEGAKRFEFFESSIAGRLGLGAAVDYALDLGLEDIWARIRELAETLRTALSGLPGTRVMDLGRERCGIVTFQVEGVSATALRTKLWENGINVTAPPVTSTPLDSQRRDLSGLIRASLHCYNSEEEIERMISVLKG